MAQVASSSEIISVPILLTRDLNQKIRIYLFPILRMNIVVFL